MSPSRIAPDLNGVSESHQDLPDFDSLPDKYGWPRENSCGYRITEQLCGTARPLRVIHLGAGASGICLARFLPETLQNVSFVCYDKNTDIGGTWWENRYPGCACDVPSANYQFTWARNPNWTHFYSSSAEIWQYFRDVVDRFDLGKHMKLRHEIQRAEWDEGKGVWEVHVKDLASGETFVDTADVFINGSGVLNHWKWPDIVGLDDFQGKMCHTANWDQEIRLEGKRVAVIGIGSSGIQVTSNIADKVSKLYTWIRAPTWITAGFAQEHAGPNGENIRYTKEQQENWTEHPDQYQAYCKDMEDELNRRFKYILRGTPEAQLAKEYSTTLMKERLKGREDLIEKLIPTTFGVGCRRPTPGNGFLEALTRPNVTVFTKSLARVTSKGFIDHDGNEHEVDVIVCATGFDTTWVPRFPIIARGKNLQDVYQGKPVSYLGIGVPEMPNYWTAVGPYGPLGHGSFLPSVELIYAHFLKLISKMQVENIKSMTPRRDVSDALVDHADLFLKRTAWSDPCRSWWKQGRLDGQLTMFPGSRLVWFDVLKEPRFEDYEIEYRGTGRWGNLRGNPFGFLGNGFHVMEFDDQADLSAYLGTKDRVGALLPPPVDMLPN